MNLIKTIPGLGDKLTYILENQTVELAQTTIPHGLPFTPTAIVIVPRTVAIIAQTAAIDATNIYLTASVAASVCDILILG